MRLIFNDAESTNTEKKGVQKNWEQTETTTDHRAIKQNEYMKMITGKNQYDRIWIKLKEGFDNIAKK